MPRQNRRVAAGRSRFLFMDYGPFFNELSKDEEIAPLPALTLSDADNTFYRAVTGDQHLLTADRGLYKRASGSSGTLINPGLIMQVSIGQTTNATRKAIANLYYRSVEILRPAEVGETLSTSTVVLGLCDASPKVDLNRGKVWLGIETRSGEEIIARYERVALLPCAGDAPGHSDEIPGPTDPASLDSWKSLAPSWDLSLLPKTAWEVGEERGDPLADHVDLAPALARFTFNQAAIHRDFEASSFGERLVYGGHTQGLAQASLTRLLPGLVTVMGWDGCDHLGPVFEGDRLSFHHTLKEELSFNEGRILRFETRATRDNEDVLLWTPIVVTT